MNRKRLLTWLLRLSGVTEMLAFIAVVMPRSWMEVSHEWLGMGVMPDAPLVMFMIRQASYAYGMHGIALWIIASDVVRFRRLVIFNGIAFLLAGPVFFIIDYTSGVPFWWTIFDALACGSVGAATLLLTWGDDS
jgi:hypothetical protein